jgi:hypothetical protein
METQTDEIEIGSQVTTPHGTGVVTWVEVGGDEFQVLRYDREMQGPFGSTGSGPAYVTVDRAHIAFWPPRTQERLSVPPTEEGK